jgi:hypothetical protein
MGKRKRRHDMLHKVHGVSVLPFWRVHGADQWECEIARGVMICAALVAENDPFTVSNGMRVGRRPCQLYVECVIFRDFNRGGCGTCHFVYPGQN